jgi:hypothetical protein
VPIPDFNAMGYLPPGDHQASLEEVGKRLATNHRRQVIFEGLVHIASLLGQHGVTRIWLGGSFVTDKLRPNDVDVVFEPPPGARTGTWGELALSRRAETKRLRRVDLLPSSMIMPSKKTAFPLVTIKTWFGTDRDDVPKGMIEVVEESSDQ